MRRDPFLHWLLMVVTFGLYAPLWTLRLARDLNRLGPAEPIAVRMHARVLGVGYALFLTGVAAATIGDWHEHSPSDPGPLFQPLTVLALAITLYSIWLLTRIARGLRSVSGTPKPRTAAVILLSCVFTTSLPYLQGHLNTLLAHRAELKRRAALV